VDQAKIGLEKSERVKSFPYELPLIGQQVGLWLKPADRRETYESTLEAIANNGELGVMDSRRLSKEAGDWVLVLSPFDLLQNTLSEVYIPKGLAYIWSSYYTYDDEAKQRAAANYHWVKGQDKGGTFYADFIVPGGGQGYRKIRPHAHPDGVLHSSGHAPFEDIVEKVALPLLNGHYNIPIFLVHGSEPSLYASGLKKKIHEQMARDIYNSEEYMRQRIGSKDLKIIKSMTRYDARHPLTERDNAHPLGIRAFTYRLF
jgi:hypothetical protein